MQDELDGIIGAIDTARAQGVLRADHRMHLRCEICAEDVVRADAATARPALRRSHLADGSHAGHAPVRRHPEAWKTYYGGKSGRTEAELNRLMDQKRARFAGNYASNRAKLVALARARSVVMASHDDATREHVRGIAG